ncbi:MAG: DedA family protein [Prevotellaceae bacterium]|jgi:membrane-associated protein|nr:DedA family protein [Prevotellaceae bacterium]
MEYVKYAMDLFLHLDVHLGELMMTYGAWVYAILFLIIFCETGLVVTPFLPGDSLLFVAGMLVATTENDLNIHLLVMLIISAAILGDAANYTIGQFFGKKLFSNPNSKIFKQRYLEQTHAFYEKYGGKTIILARFVPIVRTFAPFVAGMGKMRYRRFAVFNVAGGIAWAALFLYIGYFISIYFTEKVPFVKDHLSFFILLIVFLSLLPAIIEAYRSRKPKSNS